MHQSPSSKPDSSKHSSHWVGWSEAGPAGQGSLNKLLAEPTLLAHSVPTNSSSAYLAMGGGGSVNPGMQHATFNPFLLLALLFLWH